MRATMFAIGVIALGLAALCAIMGAGSKTHREAGCFTELGGSPKCWKAGEEPNYAWFVLAFWPGVVGSVLVIAGSTGRR